MDDALSEKVAEELSDEARTIFVCCSYVQQIWKNVE